MMKQAWTHFPLFLAALAVSGAVASGCSVSDATLKLFASEGEAGETGGGGGAGGDATTTSGTGGSAPELDCGDGTCPQGGDNACCWDGVVHNTGECIEGPASDQTCNTRLSPDGRKTRIECELPSQCGAGEVCCGAVDSTGGQVRYTSVTCASTCDLPNVELCNPENPVCPIVNSPQGMVQTVCARSQRLPDRYLVCGIP